MRFNSVGFALSVGMALIVVLFGFTLLSAAGLAGFAAAENEAMGECGVADRPDSGTGVLPVIQTKEVAAGDALFKGNCAQCHAVNEQVVGPALSGITKRRPMAWLIPWIKNSSKVVASGDEYAVALYTKYNKQQMPSFALSDEEIKSIVAYVNSQESASMAVATAL